MNKTIVITGASTGIGRATAVYFANKGWNVAATMRNTSKGEELKKIANIRVFELDVTKQESIEKAYEEIMKSYDKIDALLNNAGYSLFGPLELSSDKQIRAEFDVNVFGLINVTRKFTKHFRENRDGIIMNVSSMGGKITFPLISTYHATKFAVEGLSEVLSYELSNFNVKVKLIEPGNIATNFGTTSMAFAEIATTDEYNPYIDNMRSMIASAGEELYSQPEMVAEVIYEAATDNKDQLRYIAGDDAKQLIKMREENGDQEFVNFIKKQYALKKS